MKALITIVLVIVALLGLKELHAYWQDMKAKRRADPTVHSEGVPATATDPNALPGMPPGLEPALEAARKQGPASLKAWVKLYRPYLSDPKLAAIELDYVVLAGAKNFAEAKEVFAAVKQRTPTNSPIYPRVKQLERTFQ
jgi:hypothetical protein